MATGTALVGATVNHYHVLERLGGGGMGEVYLAEDQRLGRRVALKFLASHVDTDTEARDRLIREARAAALLRSPHIAVTYDLGEYDGSLFIAMEYVEGELLSTRIARGPLPVADGLEIALQLAMTATGRRKFVSIAEAYHGNSIATKSVGSGGADLPGSLSGCLKLEPPLDEKKLVRLERILQRRDVAALIMEPVITNLGALVPDDEFMHKVQGLCRRHGTLLIADEVATGFGRTGRMFACEHEGVAPDLMCVAKGITGGYLPLAATLASEEIYEGFLGEHEEFRAFFHGHTYTGNPLACSAALGSLDVFEMERTLVRIQPKIRLLEELLSDVAEMREVAEVRQCGLMVGIDLGEQPRWG